MNTEYITILLVGIMIVLIFLGVPVAFAIGGMVVFFTIFWWEPAALYQIVLTTTSLMNNFVLIAIPLFVLMANILQRCGVADDLFKAMHHWIGAFRGGLASGVILISTVFAAMSGVSSAGVVTMGTLALPPMIKRKYDVRLSCGAIMAGGALGQLIPPSVILIIYGLVAQQSIGQLFLAGVVPGLLLASSFIAYISITCYLKPEKGPPLPPEERVGFLAKVVMMRSVILPIVIVMMVLGSIFIGFATPTEAAALGVLGAFMSSIIYKRLNWRLIWESLTNTFVTTGIVLWIIVASVALSAVYNAIGAQEFVKNLLVGLPGGAYSVLIFMQLTFFFMGCFLDAIGILMIAGPLFIPIAQSLGFDLVWYGIVFAVNMEAAFLTPPFGMNIFLMRGIAPAWIKMSDLYKAILPFIVLDIFILAIIIAFPQLSLWLPTLVFPK